MVFLKDIVGDMAGCHLKWMLLLAWVLLALTLVLNLFSHTFTAKRHGATLAEIPENPILQEFAAHYDRERNLFYGRGSLQIPERNP